MIGRHIRTVDAPEGDRAAVDRDAADRPGCNRRGGGGELISRIAVADGVAGGARRNHQRVAFQQTAVEYLHGVVVVARHCADAQTSRPELSAVVDEQAVADGVGNWRTACRPQVPMAIWPTLVSTLLLMVRLFPEAAWLPMVRICPPKFQVALASTLAVLFDDPLPIITALVEAMALLNVSELEPERMEPTVRLELERLAPLLTMS